METGIDEAHDIAENHIADTSDAHDASAISYAGGTGMSATDVEAAIDELATEKANVGASPLVVKLTADVANATTSYANVTGLSFDVVSGTTYTFDATIIFTVNAATTGTRWSVNGPASPTQLAYTVQAPGVTATYPQPPVFSNHKVYDHAQAFPASTPETTGNMARIYGIIQPSANGTFAIRFASEVAVANGVVAKAGSSLTYFG